MNEWPLIFQRKKNREQSQNNVDSMQNGVGAAPRVYKEALYHVFTENCYDDTRRIYPHTKYIVFGQ